MSILEIERDGLKLDGKRRAEVEFIGSAILDEYHPELC